MWIKENRMGNIQEVEIKGKMVYLSYSVVESRLSTYCLKALLASGIEGEL